MAEGNVDVFDCSNSGFVMQDDARMAQTGIHMMLNNGFLEARDLFETHKNESPLMHAGSSFLSFMQALISFEEEKIEEAIKALQETEKICDPESGVFKLIKRKFSKKKRFQGESLFGIEDRIQRQVIVADSLLYQAILTFTNQDISSYIKGGWLLRRAWKLYERLHKEIVELLTQVCHSIDASLTHRSSSSSDIQLPQEGATDGNDNKLTKDILERLLGAVNFGYGTFQLCVSMVPPKILKLIEFFGFEGDRCAGLMALDYTSDSKDMKAPLAVLALLWYHTVLRPFFALDGINAAAGIQDAESIIKLREIDFPKSSLFLFFRGRVHRLKRENGSSLAMYRKALEVAAGQREIELMCLYEIGWCNLMKLKWDVCLDSFRRLRDESKWSKCYYAYLLAVCQGSLGNMEVSYNIFLEVPDLMKRKNNQIEAFASRRAEKLRKYPPTKQSTQLLTLELIFLWHALSTCTEDELLKMLRVCEQQTDNRVFHLKCLIEGAIYKELQQPEMAAQCLEEAVARHHGMRDDHHVAAFALYELASIYLHVQNDCAKATCTLLSIKERYKDYDFENRLTVRINNSLKHLKSVG